MSESKWSDKYAGKIDVRLQEELIDEIYNLCRDETLSEDEIKSRLRWGGLTHVGSHNTYIATRKYCEDYFSDVWEDATREVFDSGNAGWTMVLYEAMDRKDPEWLERKRASNHQPRKE